METMTAKVLRERLITRGIRQEEFARAVGMDQPCLSSILRGRQYLGPVRKARIERAIEQFGLDRDVPPEDGTGPVFRIRQL